MWVFLVEIEVQATERIHAKKVNKKYLLYKIKKALSICGGEVGVAGWSLLLLVEAGLGWD